MQRPRRATSILLTLCLVLMQVQVWASAGLGCHSEAAAPCTLHSEEAPRPGKSHPGCLLDCQKCALHCAVGIAAALLPATPLLCHLDGSQVADPTAGRHYYRFSPRSPHRPPIA